MNMLKEQTLLGSIKQLENSKWEVKIISQNNSLSHSKIFDAYIQAIDYRDTFLEVF